MKEHFIHSAFARRGLTDEYAFQEVVVENCYRLPERLDGPVIDIGGHVGSFVYAALERHATKVYTYEPDPRNFAHLELNIAVHPRGSVVEPYNAAVWRSDRPGELLPMAAYGYGAMTNPAGGGVAFADAVQSFLVPSISFAAVMDKIDPDEEVEYLKVDCEGAEFCILLTAPPGSLERCKRIGIETHPRILFHGRAIVHGFGPMSEFMLARYLERRGFECEIVEQPKLKGFPMIYATRR